MPCDLINMPAGTQVKTHRWLGVFAGRNEWEKQIGACDESYEQVDIAHRVQL